MVCLIDPALQDHAGNPSINLGDVVIYRAIARELERLFPGEEIRRISSHVPLREVDYDAIARSRLLILGGSNLLSSDVLAYNQWNFGGGAEGYRHPRFRDAILFGVGWWQYQPPATAFTADFYRRILCAGAAHSVRDSYTAARLKEAGIGNVAVTGCPSIWNLDGVALDRDVRWTDDCIVMLTDYKTSPAGDDRILRQVLQHFAGTIFFFPQGTGDIDYLRGMPAYQRNPARFHLLRHTLGDLEEFLRNHNATYVGTRLHGGILALNHGTPSLILGVDNRATEMARDFHLPVISRGDAKGLEKWLRGEMNAPRIEVPKAEIERWREQFTAV